MKGKKFFVRAFCPLVIYNSLKMTCQEQAEFPSVLVYNVMYYFSKCTIPVIVLHT